MNFHNQTEFDFASLMEPIAHLLLGDPNMRESKPPRELRFGTYGSMKINLEAGTFYDHEAKVGGGVIDLIKHKLGTDHAGAVAYVRNHGLLPNGSPRPATAWRKPAAAQPVEREQQQPDQATSQAEPKKVAATYDYTDEGGEVLFKVVRLEPKGFRQCRPDGLGGWIWKLDDVRRVLYRLPELLKAIEDGRNIFLVEGEKDCENVRALGFAATTNAMGASKWQPEYSEMLRGANVVVCGDVNKPGRAHVELVTGALHGIAKRIRVVDLAAEWPDCPEDGDVSKWLEAGGTADKLKAIVNALPDWQPPETELPPPGDDEPPKAGQDKIAELAALDPVEYDRQRNAAADELQIRAATLDKVVAKKRRELGLETDDTEGQGRAVKIEDATPWHEPVDGAELATALVSAAKSYVVLSEDALAAVALWVLHDWIVYKFTISPRLAVTSPTKGCGKTTVLRFLNMVGRRTKRAGSISPPALFRAVEQFQPTILLDETEKYIEHGGDLHALLNEGHCKGGTVLRVLGDKLELREFAIFGAVAFARNGTMPDDLEQRSIVIQMQRRLASEKLTELREDYCDELRELAQKCARWAEDITIGDFNPNMNGMINRVADNWRPLFAIADTIGGEWPERIRKAAAGLAPIEADSHGTILLADIKAVFDGREGEWADRMFSEMLATALAGIEGGKWAEYGKARKPITKNQLAHLLKGFKITPDTVTIGTQRLKGYYRHQFEDAFTRYLPQGVSETYKRNQPTAAGTSTPFPNVTDDPPITDQKCEKPLSPSDGYGCTDQKEDNGLADDAGPVCDQCGRPATDDNQLVGVAGGGPHVRLHRGCIGAWRELDIPEHLRRQA